MKMVLQKALRQAEEDIRRARLDTARKWKKDGGEMAGRLQEAERSTKR
ncbi:Uncharacterised protein [Escherichia coli]|uniref:Uncharacterized protein n=1 Tax=Escherichia coli TaxID=562 RepID=A0A376L2M9_ECOLX|nr:Uncharacterised protein [Escherichia coli]